MLKVFKTLLIKMFVFEKIYVSNYEKEFFLISFHEKSFFIELVHRGYEITFCSRDKVNEHLGLSFNGDENWSLLLRTVHICTKVLKIFSFKTIHFFEWRKKLKIIIAEDCGKGNEDSTTDCGSTKELQELRDKYEGKLTVSLYTGVLTISIGASLLAVLTLCIFNRNVSIFQLLS